MSETIETTLPRPEIVEKQILKVLDEAKPPGKLAVEQLIKLFSLNDQGVTDDEMELTEVVPGTDWTQSLSFSSPAPGKNVIEYWLDHHRLHSDALSADLTPICSMNFGSYRSELMAMGFEEGPSMPDGREYERHGALSHTFTRSNVVVDILSQRAVASTDGPQDACILKIEIRSM